MLPKWVSIGFTIDVRFIKGDKSKRVVIISEIRGRNAYLSGTMKLRTNRGLKRGGATGSKTGKSYAGDKTGDGLSREAANVEESSTSSG